MNAIPNLYFDGAIVGALSGGFIGAVWSDTGRAENCIFGMASGSAVGVSLLAISLWSPVVGCFCRYATYGGLLGAALGHKILRTNLINSIRVGVVYGIFIAAMGLLFGASGVYTAFIGVNIATLAYFSGYFNDTIIQRRLLIPLDL
jgi:hypothetical protein